MVSLWTTLPTSTLNHKVTKTQGTKRHKDANKLSICQSQHLAAEGTSMLRDQHKGNNQYKDLEEAPIIHHNYNHSCTKLAERGAIIRKLDRQLEDSFLCLENLVCGVSSHICIVQLELDGFLLILHPCQS